MSDDLELYRRYLEGDDDGLRMIIEKYYSGLVLYINGIIHDQDETEDIVQNTFVKLATKKPRFRGKSTLKTFVYAIARNQALSFLKRYKARFADVPIDELIIFSDGSDPEIDFLKTEQNKELREYMKELNSDYYQVLYLTYFENMKTEEIAKVMKKSNKQVGDLLYRAKKSLKNKLEGAGFSYEEF